MATMPIEQPGQPAPMGEAAGTTVCIQKLPDGTFSVYPKASEGGQAMEAQPAGTADEALELARTMLEAGGEGMTVEQAFSNGFNDMGQRA